MYSITIFDLELLFIQEIFYVTLAYQTADQNFLFNIVVFTKLLMYEIINNEYCSSMVTFIMKKIVFSNTLKLWHILLYFETFPF